MRNQLALEALGIFHIVLGAEQQHLALSLVELAHNLARRANHQRVVGDFLAFADQGLGTDDAALADLAKRTSAKAALQESALLYICGKDPDRKSVV